MPCYGIDQCAVIVAAARMDNKSGRLVYHYQLRIFIDHIQRNVLGLYCVVILRAVEHQGYDVERANLIVALHRNVVDMHESCVSRTLNAVAACVLQLLEHVLVDAQGHLSLVHDYAQMLIQLLLLVVLKFLYIIVCHINISFYRRPAAS